MPICILTVASFYLIILPAYYGILNQLLMRNDDRLLDVKKELRGTYKRHYWPDDPFTAQATSKTKKQMNRDA
jgi:hypothetical protein